MSFAQPVWLFIGALAGLALAAGFHYANIKRKEALSRFASSRLLAGLTENVSTGRRRLKAGLAVGAVILIAAALARPQAGFTWQEVKRKGIDILIALDTSKSMLAEDVRPNRLERSKLGLMDFVSRLQGDRVGLIPFAGTAYLMCPLTLDYSAFLESLNALDTTVMPQGGTNLASAIQEAVNAFDQDANHKILILMTDGEDLAGEALAAAKEAESKGLIIHTVGVGTPAGDVIPEPRAGGGVSLVRDENGQTVKSRLDEETLKKIAAETHGLFEPLGPKAEGLDRIYQEKLRLVPQKELSERMRKVPIQRFEWPLVGALVLLILELLVSDRKGRDKTKAWSGYRTGSPLLASSGHVAGQAAAKTLVLVLALVIPSVAATNRSEASDRVAPQNRDSALSTPAPQNAPRAGIQDGDGGEPDSGPLQELPKDSRKVFNLGVEAYQGADFEKARQVFQTALQDPDLSLQNRTYYNLGNTLYRQGEKTAARNPDQTISLWEQALNAYQGALKLDPQDQDARFNHDLVKARLEQLKQQQEQQQQQKQQQQQNNQDAGQENSAPNQDPQNSQNQDRKAGSGKDKPTEGQQSQDKAENHENSRDSAAEVPKGSQGRNKPRNQSRDPESGSPNQTQGSSKPEQPQGRDAGQDQSANKDQAQPEIGDRRATQAPPQSTRGQDRGSQGEPARNRQGTTGGIGQRSSGRPSGEEDPADGRMTREQAQNLLDSLKGEEAPVSILGRSRAMTGGADPQERRDW